MLFSELGESGPRASSSSVEAEVAASSGFAAQHVLCPSRAPGSPYVQSSVYMVPVRCYPVSL